MKDHIEPSGIANINGCSHQFCHPCIEKWAFRSIRQDTKLERYKCPRCPLCRTMFRNIISCSPSREVTDTLLYVPDGKHQIFQTASTIGKETDKAVEVLTSVLQKHIAMEKEIEDVWKELSLLDEAHEICTKRVSSEQIELSVKVRVIEDRLTDLVIAWQKMKHEHASLEVSLAALDELFSDANTAATFFREKRNLTRIKGAFAAYVDRLQDQIMSVYNLVESGAHSSQLRILMSRVDETFWRSLCSI